MRHADDIVRKTAVAAILHHAETAAAKRGVQVTAHLRLEQPAVPLNAHLTTMLRAAVTSAGLPSRIMTSGAGHDAMIRRAGRSLDDAVSSQPWEASVIIPMKPYCHRM